MSRIGKKEIVLPAKTEGSISGHNFSVKGPLGEMSRDIDDKLELSIADNTIRLKPKKEDDDEAAVLWGTYASHVSNMVRGVSSGFEKNLLIEGIGFRVENKGDKLVFALGFSHPVEVPIPQGIKALVEKNAITISGIDKELVGSFAAHIRSLKKPEPYKGKGIRYKDEVVKIKQGKKTTA
ncbi:MAG: 50S ribosomal protein L6 [Candidatus Zambryskibacteria bacterium CG_4_9_14_3_um_filter_40_16]|uniref:Large ribosomal subunit protein uL6 n=2 Tax=Candidatus Zambryskiibacteriota TaxID=1817925 RepID=A0A2H0K682_9BACT|nr:MAG: 50S ribosomal protein L6 [Candidatus Zambryskibacteria bacterium CG11_big_fil_rev_8_21_14_0_20_40_24]PJA33731.1 MAG: 50S ribosomal protein L6 [Candidatus Zambryskibacteria bacterium CG_4_9_14_3_um_filter_40_16]